MALPSWVDDILPQDLKKVLQKDITKPTTKGRKSAIDEDNVNDLAYYFTNKRYKIDPIRVELKGTGMTPDQYAKEHKKYKSYSYLFSQQYLRNPLNPLSSEAPLWYKCFYLHRISLDSCDAELVYELFNQVPIECTKDIIQKLENLKKVNRKNPGFFKRQKLNKEKDIAFYQRLSESDKEFILGYMQKKLIKFDIEDYVMNEGSYNEVASLLPMMKLADYTIQKGKIEEFKQFVDSHRSLFENFANYQIICPKYRQLYEYAFANEEIIWQFDPHPKDDECYEFIKRFYQLCDHGLTKEIAFLKKHGLILNDDHFLRMIFRLRNKTTIDYLHSEVPGAFDNAMQYLLLDDEKTFNYMLEIGYHPSVKAVCVFYEHNKGNTRGQKLEFIDTIAQDQPLDKLKMYIAGYHPKLIKQFIERYGHRFVNNDIKSWGMSVVLYCWENYEIACQELDFDPSEFIPSIVNSAFNGIKMNIDKTKSKHIILGCVKKYKATITEEQAKIIFKADEIDFATDLVCFGINLAKFEDLKFSCSIKMRRAIFHE